MDWKEMYPKSKRPGIADLESYLDGESVKLFREFTSILSQKLHLTYVRPVYISSKGWCFEIGRSGLIMVKEIAFGNGLFYVNGIEVSSRKALNEILQWTEDEYHNRFISQFDQYSAERVEKQKQRDMLRRQKEKEYIASVEDKLDKSKLNIFRWAPRVPRNKLQRLYESDARGMLDTELLDEVGYSMYARCLQAKEEYMLMESGKIKCHNCHNILKAGPKLSICTCGYQYIYRDYRRSFRANNMPTGGAAHIFDEFINKWERANTGIEKMRLIDWLIHEFHINLLSGSKGRFVGINLIQGNKFQIKDLIINLAYGSGGIASEDYKKYYEQHA